MTIFNTIQLPAFNGTTKVAQPALPQFSMPDDEAIRVFQHTYERPAELPQTAELPAATPETLAKVVEENLTLAKALPTPLVLPEQPTTPVAAPVAAERPAGLPAVTPETNTANLSDRTIVTQTDQSVLSRPPRRAQTRAGQSVPTPVAEAATVRSGNRHKLAVFTPETLAKVVEENLTLAKELPTPVVLPGKSAVAMPVREDADGTVGSAGEPVNWKMSEDTDDSPLPQALPETVAGAVPAVAPTVTAQEATPVADVAAKVSVEAPRTASSVVIEAASAVADTLLVSPNLMRGDGEIRVQLKPDVLDGAQICIKVMGKSMQVEFASVTDDIARLMTAAQPQLIQRLAEKIPTYEVAVTVLPGTATVRRRAPKGVGRSGEEA